MDIIGFENINENCLCGGPLCDNNNQQAQPIIVTETSMAAFDCIIESVGHVFCKFQSTGSINVGIVGGTMPYIFTLNGTTPSGDPTITNEQNNTGVFTNLPAGFYTIEVTDAVGETSTCQQVIFEPDGLLLCDDIIVTQPSCNNSNDGKIEITVIGGTPPYSYKLLQSPNGMVDNGNNPIFENLGPGGYVAEITDVNDCTSICRPVIISNPEIVLCFVDETTNTTSPGGSDGTVQLSATGGTGNYTFELNGIENTTGFFDGLSAGNHEATITDGNGCSCTANVNIMDP